jgi:UDP-2-acetamido-2,6-beta-L-arabino-hexul-4-ose reductase
VRVLITGANGFIGSNLAAQLSVRAGFEVVRYSHQASDDEMRRAVSAADFVCHLAGVNRPEDEADFSRVNTGMTAALCDAARDSGRAVPIIFASSVHVERGNAYGDSKRAAEEVLLRYSEETGAAVHIFRLGHVIGKWCRPNYNSVVATFCHNIARGLPLEIHDPSFPLRLIYIDDLVECFARLMAGERQCATFCEVEPSYSITVGELANHLYAFRDSRESLLTERVGSGLMRALHSTYLSHLPPESFVYELPQHVDPRGRFVEMLKTRDSGQFSFFTAPPGVTRGGHYHHSKTEKFLVVTGRARFRFRNILGDEHHEVVTCGERPQVVETVPGWAHDITNVGEDEMIVLLWSNEVFDPARPDTFSSPL